MEGLVILRLAFVRNHSHPPDHTVFPSPTSKAGCLVHKALWPFFSPAEIYLFSF